METLHQTRVSDKLGTGSESSIGSAPYHTPDTSSPGASPYASAFSTYSSPRTSSDSVELIRQALSKFNCAHRPSPLLVETGSTMVKDEVASAADDLTSTNALTDGLTRTATVAANSHRLATESPYEGCFSDSAGSPASARDFLTSPSLFDDCDFEFDNDSLSNLPLFGGPSFDSQVYTAGQTSHTDSLGSEASQPADMGTEQSKPVSPLFPLEESKVDSRSEAHLPDQVYGQDALAHLEQSGLSCYTLASAGQASTDQARTEVLENQKLFGDAIFQAGSLATDNFASSYGGQDETGQAAVKVEDSHDERLGLSMTAWPSSQRSLGTLAAAFDRLAGAHRDSGSPGEMPSNLVPYYSSEDLVASSESTLAMAMPAKVSPVAPAPSIPLLADAPAHTTAAPVASIKSEDNGQALESDQAADVAGQRSKSGPVRPKRKRVHQEKSRVAKRPAASTTTPATPDAASGDKHKRFQCNVCFKWFDRAFNLKTHMFTHEDPDTRSKNYICPDDNCSKAFARKHDMKRHFNTVHLKIVKRTSRKPSAHTARDDDLG